MKLLLYSHSFAPDIGGVETQVMLLARGLTARTRHGSRRREDAAQVTVVTKTWANGFDDESLPFRIIRRPPVKRLWRLIGEADVVHLAGPVFLPLVFGLLLRKPLVVKHHGYQASCPNGLLFVQPAKCACPGHFMAHRYHRCLRCVASTAGLRRSVVALGATFLRRLMAGWAAANVTASGHVLERLRLPRSRVIYHGVPDPLAADDKCLPQETGRPPTFVYIGRLVSEKGTAVLLKAGGQLKREGYEFRIEIFGDGPERPALEALAKELELVDCVALQGWRRSEALEEAVRGPAAIIMPSVMEETAGWVAIEHMIRGRVVIASDIGGLAELVDGAGLKFTAGDAKSLAACMRQIIENDGLSADLGSKARKRALELFREDRMLEEHLAVYREVLHRERGETQGGGQRIRRLAVVSPFIDRYHGTERCVAELIDHLANSPGWEVHLYSERVEGVSPRVVWHRVPAVPGPHLVRYLWWFLSNHLWRWWDGVARGLRFDLTYSPGVNCFDADVVMAHIVFATFYSQVRTSLALSHNPLRSWPRLIHRRLYYQLIMALEKRVYARGCVRLAAPSRKTATDVGRLYGRNGDVIVVYHGVDHAQFNPEARRLLRHDARHVLGLSDNNFALLLVGNDWKNKGLPVLLESLARLQERALYLLVVGRDDDSLFRSQVTSLGLGSQVRVLPPRPDVQFYYAATDCYVGPSLEDAFGLPPAEAMACGLPVIVSSRAGVAEIVTHGVDGLVLQDPHDAAELASLIRQVYEDSDLRKRLGQAGARTAREYTWDRNVAGLCAIFETSVLEKVGR
jgi:glycosyltransferase involved in cell wall biosynthesis